MWLGPELAFADCCRQRCGADIDGVASRAGLCSQGPVGDVGVYDSMGSPLLSLRYLTTTSTFPSRVARYITTSEDASPFPRITLPLQIKRVLRK